MDKQLLQTKLNNISNLLADLEETIRKDFNTPEANINKADFLLINIPNNYIRKADYYRDEYKLTALFGGNKVNIDNVAYSLQLSDLYNYFINRFNLFFSVGKLFIKSALINVVSIQEAILYCTLSDLHNFCTKNGSVCKYNGECKFYIKSIKDLRFNSGLTIYKDRIGLYHEIVFSKLKELKSLRDNIHIHDVNFNEFLQNEKYSLAKYNEAILILRFLKTYLPNKIKEFQELRMLECSKKTL